jgi:hypothetical protein
MVDDLALSPAADLTLEEPDIEDIVRRIYRGEAGLGGTGPGCGVVGW